MFIDSSDYMKLRSYLNQSHEVGGYFELTSGGRLVPHMNSNGASSSISMGNQPYLFHTHPGICVDKSNCSFGVPSSQDMMQIYEDSFQGNIAHFIIAHEGLYVVQSQCRNMSSNEIKEKFKQFQDSMLKTTYNDFMIRWISFANQNGFNVLYYSPSQSPVFSIRSTSC